MMVMMLEVAGMMVVIRLMMMGIRVVGAMMLDNAC